MKAISMIFFKLVYRYKYLYFFLFIFFAGFTQIYLVNFIDEDKYLVTNFHMKINESKISDEDMFLFYNIDRTFYSYSYTLDEHLHLGEGSNVNMSSSLPIGVLNESPFKHSILLKNQLMHEFYQFLNVYEIKKNLLINEKFEDGFNMKFENYEETIFKTYEISFLVTHSEDSENARNYLLNILSEYYSRYIDYKITEFDFIQKYSKNIKMSDARQFMFGSLGSGGTIDEDFDNILNRALLTFESYKEDQIFELYTKGKLYKKKPLSSILVYSVAFIFSIIVYLIMILILNNLKHYKISITRN